MTPPPPPTEPTGTPARPSIRLLRRLDERFSGLTVLLVLADLAALSAALLLVGANPVSPAVAVAAGLLLCCRASARIYRSRLRLSWFDDLPRELVAVTAAVGLFVMGGLVLDLGRGMVPALPGVLVAALLGLLLRAGVFQIARIARRSFGHGDRTVVIGTGRLATDLTQAMLEHPEFGLRPVGLVRTGRGDDPADVDLPVITEPLVPAVVRTRAASVVFACPDVPDEDTLDAAIQVRRVGATVLIVPRMFELYHDGAGVERLRSFPLVRLASDPTRRPTWWIKRGLDAAAALLGLALVSPLLLAAAVAILVESGRPVFFSQLRVGLDGEPFTLFKLRSLRPADDSEQQTLWSVARDPRVGPVGRFLRRTSLDELPQLWNIVRGDMSLVGPRPERPSFVAQFSETHDRYAARHRVPAGLTGLSQVNGLRGDTSIADRVRHDNYYIANWSLWLDARILLLTAREVLRRGQH
ncbi:exopolysaccharide biosynthesis polyprenyl glycosylphosphotransferase [Pseudonocardia sp. KRD291]|uniref:exopolysaccharide biosynthesis polyprenyl glycosylphosphotransferase n=1 Tax=Pseudonocardia sp. KRD291 TaxID=2792007 RepID=UPI001C4A3AEC|nr:exopolysaccharide biosynthesis polyprenyl glycosylphosphotransferase [Pseudonocardia sp. KRD291]MBW0101568.1 exopolysaccharide biosynthesis polyprenyl glycosylphosphotransferase [Pseudonocardia sp. KRD291]